MITYDVLDDHDDILVVELLDTKQTQFGEAHVFTTCTEDDTLVRILEVGDGFQSATYVGPRWTEPVFGYFRAFDAIVRNSDPATPREVLMLGGGGYAWPRHILATHPDIICTVVEVDPAIMRIAKRWFYGSKTKAVFGDRFCPVCADALTYIREQARSHRFCAIANDVYAGIHAPASLAEQQSLAWVKGCLVPGGVYGINMAVDPNEGYGELFDMVCRLQECFTYVETVMAPDDDFGAWENYIVVASDGELQLSNTVAW